MSSHQMKYGVILSYASYFLSMASGLLLTPLLIRGMGNGQYGLYQLIGATVGYLGLLDFGFGAAVTRYVAKYNAENDTQGRENFLGLVFAIYACMVALGVLLGAFVYVKIALVFPNLHAEELRQARLMWCFLVVSFGFSMIGNVFQGALSGSQEFIFTRSLAVGSELLRVLGTLFIIYRHYGAVELTLMGSLLGILSWIGCVVYFFRKLHYRIAFRFWNAGLFREMFGYSFFIFLGQMMSVMYWRIGIFILGVLSTTGAVAVYSIAMNLNGIFLIFVTSINSVLLPRLTHMVVQQATNAEKTEFVARVGRIILFVYGYLLIGFSFFGRQFISLWLGPDYQEAWTATMIVVWAAAIPRIQGATNDLMKAMNRHQFLSIMYVAMGLLNVLVAVLLVKRLGIIGVAIGTATALIAGNLVIANIYYQRALGIQVREFFRITFSRSGTALLASAGVALLAGQLPFAGWRGFLIKGTCFTLAYLAIFWNYAWNANERSLVRSLVPEWFMSERNEAQ
ncbi:MAG: oligosaccharide flippase family protein [Holophagaceae bacterium]|nr:oligosaccharide flippase family protein [Holophagaceae bacterium]